MSTSSALHDAAEAFRIRFHSVKSDSGQDEESFEFVHGGSTHRLRIHDYAEIYSVPGLYEAIVYDKLKCTSPPRLARLIRGVIPDWETEPGDLRVLDLGAGNGIMAEELRNIGVKHIVGLDLLPEAKMAAERDRPDVYNDYVVADLTALTKSQRERLKSAKFNCLVTAAALGFGDVPPEAFANAYNMVCNGGWVAMTIKEDFLNPRSDDSGFARMIRHQINIGAIDIQAHHRYCHRVSIAGDKLFYVGLVARKTADIALDHLDDSDQRNGTTTGTAPATAKMSRPTPALLNH